MQLLLQCFDEYKITHIFREANRMLAPKITLFFGDPLMNMIIFVTNLEGGLAPKMNFFVIL